MKCKTCSYSRTRARKMQRGFTLVELSVSLFVLAVVVVIFGSTVILAERSAGVKQSPGMNGQYTQALSICQHKMDQLRGKGFGGLTYDELEPLIIDGTPLKPPYKFTDVDHIGNYLVNPVTSLNIEKWSGDLTNNTMLVTISVTWQNLSSESKTSKVTVYGLITNVGD